MFIEKCLIKEDGDQVKLAIISLAGRNNSADGALNIAENLCIPNAVCVGVQPIHYEWYPAPINSQDQEDAILGLPIARDLINELIDRISRAYKLRDNKIALIGYSAGGVMANEVGIRRRLACVGSLCSAILEPNKIPMAKATSSSPILLVHHKDDMCFEWEERYLPTKKALIDKGYDLSTSESPNGGHGVDIGDVIKLSKYVGNKFKIKNWMHPRERQWRAWQQRSASQ